MNPFIQALLLALIRSGLLWLAGHLKVQSTEAELGSAAVAILMGAWSVYDKYKSHQKLLTAQATAQVTTQEVNDAVKAGAAPSVMTPKTEIPVMKND